MKLGSPLTFFRRRRLAAPLALALLTGCVTNPITGNRQFSIVGKSQLVSLAREAVPAQFSSDYGVVDDAQANAYVSQIGRKLVATLTPADVVFPDMPFTFQVVNAVYVNAYAFPDGTIAVTRGMLAELENEAQLAAVLGHEIAHVNCGHTASAMSRSMVYSALIAGAQGYLASKGSKWTDLAGTAGQLGGAVVLASYSRAQERQADQGGMQYMVRAGYDPQGMVELSELLVKLSGSNPSALERMFSTHPMSTERLQAARTRASALQAGGQQGVVNREAFLSATAGIRKNKPAIQKFAEAEKLLASKKSGAARAAAEQGLVLAPNDYVGLMLVAQANQQTGQAAAARQAAQLASRVNPAGARAHGVLSQCALLDRDYSGALAHLNQYERLVPGDASTLFFKGLAFEGQGRQRDAAAAYDAYLRRAGTESNQGQYALRRLQAYTSPPRP